MTASEEAYLTRTTPRAFLGLALMFLGAWAGLLLMQNPTIAAGDSGETVTRHPPWGLPSPGTSFGGIVGALALALSIGTAAFRINLLSSLAAISRRFPRRLDEETDSSASGTSSGWSVLAVFACWRSLRWFSIPIGSGTSLDGQRGCLHLSLLWSVCLLRSISFRGRTNGRRDLPLVFFWEGLAFATHWPTAFAGGALARCLDLAIGTLEHTRLGDGLLGVHGGSPRI
jgi:hypothetical protein